MTRTDPSLLYFKEGERVNGKIKVTEQFSLQNWLRAVQDYYVRYRAETLTLFRHEVG